MNLTDDDNTWRIYGVKGRSQFRRFLNHLHRLFPEDYTLTFGYEREPVKLAEFAEVTLGGWDGLWYVVNVPLTREKLGELYRVLEGAPDAYFEPFYLYVSKNVSVQPPAPGQAVVEANDRGQYGIYITSAVPEEVLRDFCRTIPCLYQRSSEEERAWLNMPEVEVWKVKLPGGSREFLRQLHLLIPKGAVMAVPEWTNPWRRPPFWVTGLNLLFLQFLRSRQLPEECINPLIEEAWEVLTLLESLTGEGDWDPEEYPDEIHIEASSRNLEELADLLREWPADVDPLSTWWSPGPEGHLVQLGFYVHVGAYVVVAYDAEESALLVASDVPREQVRAFCKAVGARYRRTTRKTIVGWSSLVKVDLPPQGQRT